MRVFLEQYFADQIFLLASSAIIESSFVEKLVIYILRNLKKKRKIKCVLKPRKILKKITHIRVAKKRKKKQYHQ